MKWKSLRKARVTFAGKKDVEWEPGLVRLAHPSKPGFYYYSNANDWVQRGYTRWSLKEWKAKFGSQNDEGRKWEFFGYEIPLYDEDDPAKTR